MKHAHEIRVRGREDLAIIVVCIIVPVSPLVQNRGVVVSSGEDYCKSPSDRCEPFDQFDNYVGSGRVQA